VHAMQLFLAQVKTGESWTEASAAWAEAEAHWLESVRKGYIAFPPTSEHRNPRGGLDRIGPAKLTFQGMRALAQG
jgi:hypothetical protein